MGWLRSSVLLIDLHSSTIGVLLALVAGGIGLPLPEDVVLLAAGWLVWRGDATFTALAPLALVAVVCGDLVLYGVGRASATHPRIARWLERPRLQRLRDQYRRHDVRLLMIARVAIGARAAFFLSAGVARVPVWRFLVVDTLCGAVMVTLWMKLGAHLGDRLEELRPLLHAVTGVIVAVLVLWVLARARAVWRAAEAEE
jgi:membrane protein DedA with SNARE-associated domain